MICCQRDDGWSEEERINDYRLHRHWHEHCGGESVASLPMMFDERCVAVLSLSRPADEPFSADELKYRTYSKKSLVAARDLASGSVIGPDDLVPLRTGMLGVAPDQAEAIIGRTTARDIRAFDPVSEEWF